MGFVNEQAILLTIINISTIIHKPCLCTNVTWRNRD